MYHAHSLVVLTSLTNQVLQSRRWLVCRASSLSSQPESISCPERLGGCNPPCPWWQSKQVSRCVDTTPCRWSMWWGRSPVDGNRDIGHAGCYGIGCVRRVCKVYVTLSYRLPKQTEVHVIDKLCKQTINTTVNKWSMYIAAIDELRTFIAHIMNVQLKQPISPKKTI